MIKHRKYIVGFLILALILNVALPAFISFEGAKKQTKYKELSKVLGETVYICDSSYAKDGYLSSFKRLDQEQHQKLKKLDLASFFHVPTDSKYINDVYSAYVTAVHSGSIKPFTTISKPEANQLSLKFSTAPPYFS